MAETLQQYYIDSFSKIIRYYLLMRQEHTVRVSLEKTSQNFDEASYGKVRRIIYTEIGSDNYPYAAEAWEVVKNEIDLKNNGKDHPQQHATRTVANKKEVA